ncbi:MAG: DUF5668 domain-containing protein [Bacteroides sp.]|nr:DUF5668 domain-containing protein [Bacteroides sp.]
MKKYKHGHPAWHHQLNSLFFAGLFIVSGSLLLARNLGLLSPYVFGLWVSWPTLLIAWGILQLIKSHISSGLILAAVGSYFLLPRIQGIDMLWISLYWPVFLIIAGIWLLTKMWRHKNQFHNKQENYTSASYTTTEGFVQSEITFGGTEHIVLDPVFNGAHIINTFGSTLLDLRNTRL